jgi:hypothetical protein
MPHLTPFQMSLALSAGLSAVWMYTHPDVLTHIARPQVADVAQLYSLASVALGNVFNLLVVGPMTSRYKLFPIVGNLAPVLKNMCNSGLCSSGTSWRRRKARHTMSQACRTR